MAGAITGGSNNDFAIARVDESERIDRMLADYNPADPPFQDGLGTVPVAVAFRANKLLSVDQAERSVTWVGWVRRYWYDPRLAYSSKNFAQNSAASLLEAHGNASAGARWDSDKDFFRIDPEQIWLPDIKVANALEFTGDECSTPTAFLYDDAGTPLSAMNVHNEKVPLRYNVAWSQPCVLKVKCDIDFRMFPFDTTVCPINFEPWGDTYLRMVVASENNENLVTLPEFAVSIAEATSEEVPYKSMRGQMWPRVVVRYKIARHGHYYVVNFICPILLMLMLTWISFWITKAASDRIMFMVTIVLTVMAVNFITAEKRPATDTDMWLDQFQTRTLLLVVTVTFYTVWLSRWEPGEDWEEEDIARRKHLLELIDRWMRLLFPIFAICYLASLFRALSTRRLHETTDELVHVSSASSEVFLVLLLMIVFLCCGAFAQVQDYMEQKTRELEDLSDESAATDGLVHRLVLSRKDSQKLLTNTSHALRSAPEGSQLRNDSTSRLDARRQNRLGGRTPTSLGGETLIEDRDEEESRGEKI
jgi:hypothetical protein